MRTDIGAGGWSRLSIWCVTLGIRNERIDPGHPSKRTTRVAHSGTELKHIVERQ